MVGVGPFVPIPAGAESEQLWPIFRGPRAHHDGFTCEMKVEPVLTFPGPSFAGAITKQKSGWVKGESRRFCQV